jgi:hypothetical protein
MVESAIGRLHRPPRVPAGLPYRLDVLLRRMTARQPSERPTARAVHRALRNDDLTVLLPAVLPRELPKLAHHRRRLLAAGIPAVAMIVAAGAILLQRPDVGPSPSPVQPVAATPPSQPPPGPSVPPRALAPAGAEISVEPTEAQAPAGPRATPKGNRGIKGKPDRPYRPQHDNG